MPRLIDADEAYKVLTDYYHHKTETQHEVLKEALSRVPTVDAVEVVRCKDCKWCHGGYCEKADDIIPFGFPQHEWENFYCAWGERKEDAET